jgi:hypothetical protein
MLGVAVCLLVVPAVALAASFKVSGTSGDDLLTLDRAGNNARLVLNGATVGSLKRGDSVDATLGAGSDTVAFTDMPDDNEGQAAVRASLGGGDDTIAFVDMPDDNEGQAAVRASLGGGDDLALFSSHDIDPPGAGPGIDVVDGGSGSDILRLHNYGDTNRIRVDGGSGDDAAAVRYSQTAGKGLSLTVNLGSGNDRLTLVAPGAARVRGGNGGDRINTRGGGQDRISCGSGKDRVRVDKKDRVASDCETVRRR